MNRDLQARIDNAFHDYMDLIERKANEALAIGCATVAGPASPGAAARLRHSGTINYRKEHRDGGTANNLPPSNS